MKILAVANQKGGVGKSTLAVHLAYAAIEQGKRVLLLDMDKQGSLGLSFPPAHSTPNPPPTLSASMLYADVLPKLPVERLHGTLAIIRADNALLSIDRADNAVIYRPKQWLRQLPEAIGFDLCIIDTPPLLGVRLMASLAAADAVVTPVSMGLYELSGVADLMQTIHIIRTQGFNPTLQHIGILPMKTNNRSSEEQESLALLRERYGDAILETTLPERAPIRKAIAKRIPVWTKVSGEGHIRAAKEWRAACEQILEKLS
ncbi:ParA family protein [Conchiformibius steedae]|uniref:ParA family protein n=1 Tax=Conchiformibius steedae TaxID=153493 RepID=A0A3P2A1F6_9NEIS|nr:ParA family protein [Conchiformibius steedae]RRD89254.1 ParA family protein [Conchiformibius steedae]